MNKAKNAPRKYCIKCTGKQSSALQKKIRKNPMFGKKECKKCDKILSVNLFHKKENYKEICDAPDTDARIDECIVCYNSSVNYISKQCNSCVKILKHSNFGSDPTKSDGVHTICKVCRAETARLRREKNKLTAPV